MTGICDVHRWALNDKSKREVSYCRLCNAWICKECKPKVALRATATANRLAAKIKGK